MILRAFHPHPPRQKMPHGILYLFPLGSFQVCVSNQQVSLAFSVLRENTCAPSGFPGEAGWGVLPPRAFLSFFDRRLRHSPSCGSSSEGLGIQEGFLCICRGSAIWLVSCSYFEAAGLALALQLPGPRCYSSESPKWAAWYWRGFSWACLPWSVCSPVCTRPLGQCFPNMIDC